MKGCLLRCPDRDIINCKSVDIARPPAALNSVYYNEAICVFDNRDKLYTAGSPIHNIYFGGGRSKENGMNKSQLSTNSNDTLVSFASNKKNAIQSATIVNKSLHNAPTFGVISSARPLKKANIEHPSNNNISKPKGFFCHINISADANIPATIATPPIRDVGLT